MDDDVISEERAKAREKQRRHRELIKAGRACLTIETDLGVLGDLLRDAGLTSLLSEDDPALLARGLEQLLQRLRRYA